LGLAGNGTNCACIFKHIKDFRQLTFGIVAQSPNACMHGIPNDHHGSGDNQSAAGGP
jgi:hypothetical protein